MSNFFTLDSDDNTVLAFKPTVPSIQKDNQQQKQQLDSNMQD
jgi:hypothetical protein